jgi:hypothetical protein
LNREGEFQPVAYVERTSTKTKDYGDYVTGGVQHLPGWADGDAGRFFTEAKAHEGVNRYHAFQLEFSLPRELTHDQHMALREDFMATVMPDLPALWVKHEKRLDSGEMHPHVHILFSARKQDGIARDVHQTFRRWNRQHPERGGCEKDLFWSARQAPGQVRQAFADITNYHLTLAHAEERVDPRSLMRREIQRLAIGRGGERPSPEKLAQENARAVAAWEQRKAFKNIGPVQDIPREVFVQQVRQWARDYERGQEIPRVSSTEMHQVRARDLTRLTTEGKALEKHLAALKLELSTERRYTAMGKARPPAGVARVEKLLAVTGEPQTIQRGREDRGRTQTRTAQVQALRRSLKQRGQGQEGGVGGSLRIRLYEEEERKRQQERDRGMSF